VNRNQPNPFDQQQPSSPVSIAELQRRVRVGASNFYWIGGLSAVNTLFLLFGASVTFPIGLAITRIVSAFAANAAINSPGTATMFQGIGVLINLVIAGLFALFAFLAIKRRRWVYLLGVALYGLDALLTLIFSDYAGFAFHLFFLWLLFGGMQADRKLGKPSPPGGPDLSFPKNIGMP
jgi:hypothetical protein